MDTGADRSILPAKMVQELGVPETGDVKVVGLGGQLHTIPTYAVQIEIKGLTSVMVDVAATGGEPCVLLGHDVLKHFRMVFDGPASSSCRGAPLCDPRGPSSSRTKSRAEGVSNASAGKDLTSCPSRIISCKSLTLITCFIG